MTLRVTYQALFYRLQQTYQIRDDEYEHLYDWLIIEAFTNTQLIPVGTTVHGHYKHDVYLQAYYDLKLMFENWLRNHLAFKGITFVKNRTVKALVAGPNLIIVIQRGID